MRRGLQMPLSRSVKERAEFFLTARQMANQTDKPEKCRQLLNPTNEAVNGVPSPFNGIANVVTEGL
jgi:hypothetical protein